MVPDADTRADYNCNGATTVFAVPWYFLEDSHLRVLLTAVADETYVPLTLGVDYSVTGAGNELGGSITTAATYSNAYRIGVIPDIPFDQTTELENGDKLPAASLERMADKTVMLARQLKEMMGRAVRGSENSSAVYQLPPPSVGSALGWVTADKIGNVANSAVGLAADLANTTDAAKGIGMSGYDPSLDYDDGTAGKALNDLAASASLLTTSGSSPNFTIDPTPALTSYTTGAVYEIMIHADGSTGSNTLNVSGLGAVALKQPNASGALVDAVIKSGQIAKVRYNGTYWVVLNPLPPQQIQPLTATVASNALTVTLGSNTLDFRSATLGSGDVNSRGVISASLVVPSGATLGTVGAVPSRIVVLALDNAGTVELAVVNLAGGKNLDETTLISTTALSAASDAANVAYSTTARTDLPFRVVGYIESTQATAGTWATAPSTIQGIGGQALAALSSLGYGQSYSSPGRALGTTYANNSGKPIMVLVTAHASVTGNNTISAYVNSVIVVGSGVYSGDGSVSFVVPPGATYSVAVTLGTMTLTNWYELK